jgi:hypothetical protein
MLLPFSNAVMTCGLGRNASPWPLFVVGWTKARLEMVDVPRCCCRKNDDSIENCPAVPLCMSESPGSPRRFRTHSASSDQVKQTATATETVMRQRTFSHPKQPKRLGAITGSPSSLPRPPSSRAASSFESKIERLLVSRAAVGCLCAQEAVHHVGVSESAS